MNKAFIGFLILSSAISYGETSKPKNPSDRTQVQKNVGIGRYETNLKLVHRFMDFVKWDSNTTFEETGLNMESLILKLVNKNIEKNWIEEVVAYSQSTEFLSQDQSTKDRDIFETKLYIKMIIADSGLLE